MKILSKKKTSNGVRHQLNIKKNLLCKKSLSKILVSGKKKSTGRGSFFGRITSNHKGGGVKQLFRRLNEQPRLNFSLLLGVYYDPKRSSFISLSFDLLTNTFSFNLNTNHTYPGALISSFVQYPELRLSSSIQIKRIPAGSVIHSIRTGKKAVYVKSAGVFGTILQNGSSFCKIKLPSGAIKQFSSKIFCILGSLGNQLHSSVVWGKAGRSRLRNKRPTVRGVAMNPVDHPHGGQTSGGMPSVTPWGLPARGRPTKKKYV